MLHLKIIFPYSSTTIFQQMGRWVSIRLSLKTITYCFRYIRFLMNTASRILFLGILILSTLTTSVQFDVATSPFFFTSELAAFLSYKGPPPSTLTVVIYIWIAGERLTISLYFDYMFAKVGTISCSRVQVGQAIIDWSSSVVLAITR